MTPHPAARPTPRQQEILERALDLVREGGLGGLTMRKISERVGFTEAALFRHFPSKQALLLALMDRLEDMLLGSMRTIAGDASLSAPERLQEMVRHHTRLVLEHDSLPILLLAEASASGDAALLARMRSILRGYLSLLEGVVREGQGRGDLTNAVQPDCLAILLLGAPAGLAIRHRLLPNARVEQRFEDTLIPFLRSGIDADQGRIP